MEIHKPDEREIYNAICREFWAPHNPGASLPKRRDKAFHLLLKTRTTADRQLRDPVQPWDVAQRRVSGMKSAMLV
ncbi:P-loop NTPase family protein [Pseudomonas huanghezhanensis]|uniref:hypothetical protein n=1 Tax=Pseudomonas huanghezhanensis TaxID=3002903 RepID=UPI0022854103|nr:hypothetical protein [Pseudomonas sp. BSw22131]